MRTQNRFDRQARWYRPAQLTARQLSPRLRDVLLDPGSLTQRLMDICPGGFRVRLLGQWRMRPETSERRVLTMGQHDIAFIREVRLYCHDTPWIFARSVIPQSTLTGAQRRLAHLGEKPLGAVLFADRSMMRGPVELANIVPRHTIFRRALDGIEITHDAFWGRRSIFHVGGKPLLVSEFFLPSCELGAMHEG